MGLIDIFITTKDRTELFDDNWHQVGFTADGTEYKLYLDGDNEFTVRDLIKNVEKRNDFGKKVINVQMKMLRVLCGAD